mmetsp:Transcript_33495/g.52722  ORF Transcript_33495/g.52722 Transcript_33495/m.52722 type:complete len:287 (-) Transcript_33495:1332-2192(-)
MLLFIEFFYYFSGCSVDVCVWVIHFLLEGANLELVIPKVIVIIVVAAAAGGLALVQFLHDGARYLLHLLLLVLVVLGVALRRVVQPVQRVVDGALQLLLVGGAQLVAQAGLVVVQDVLQVVQVGLEAVAGVDALLDGLVLLRVLLGLADHPLNLLLRQAALVGCDGDLFGLSCALVSSRHLQDTIGVDLKGDLNLGDTAGGRGDASQLKLAEHVVVLGHGTLALVHLNEHSGLVVLVGGEGLGLLGGNDSVAVDDLGHDATHSLNTVGEGSHIQQEQVLGLLRGLA